jgi:hypothetical protein
MVQITKNAFSNQKNQKHSSLAFILVEIVVGTLFCAAVVFGTFSILNFVFGLPVAQIKHVVLNLSIFINQPGKQKDWPEYANTNLVVPANSVVTVTIHNYDLGDTPLPSGSPFGKVQGTVGNIALAEGKVYGALALNKIAHTFAVSQLGLSVPIPGDVPKGVSYASVTFTFHSGKAGTYTFRCFDPCGTGASGWMGPMLKRGYMIGTLTVQ